MMNSKLIDHNTGSPFESGIEFSKGGVLASSTTNNVKLVQSNDNGLKNKKSDKDSPLRAR